MPATAGGALLGRWSPTAQPGEGAPRRPDRRPLAVVRRPGGRRPQCTSRRCAGSPTSPAWCRWSTRPRGRSARRPQARAADLNAAFADPGSGRSWPTIGGEDQITVIPHLDADLVRADPKPFLGYSDNTNLLHWLWTQGVAGFYGGSSQVHLGAGPGRRRHPRRSLRAALLTGERLEITDPGESEDIGIDWADPRGADRRSATASRPSRGAGTARPGGHRPHLGRLPRGPAVDPDRGPLPVRPRRPRRRRAAARDVARSCSRRARSAGSCAASASAGCSRAVDAVLVARPPVSDFTRRPAAAERARAARRAARRRDRRRGPLQPGGRGLRRGALRPHPAAVDPAARRPGHRRRRGSSGSWPTTPEAAGPGLGR